MVIMQCHVIWKIVCCICFDTCWPSIGLAFLQSACLCLFSPCVVFSVLAGPEKSQTRSGTSRLWSRWSWLCCVDATFRYWLKGKEPHILFTGWLVRLTDNLSQSAYGASYSIIALLRWCLPPDASLMPGWFVACWQVPTWNLAVIKGRLLTVNCLPCEGSMQSMIKHAKDLPIIRVQLFCKEWLEHLSIYCVLISILVGLWFESIVFHLCPNLRLQGRPSFSHWCTNCAGWGGVLDVDLNMNNHTLWKCLKHPHVTPFWPAWSPNETWPYFVDTLA